METNLLHKIWIGQSLCLCMSSEVIQHEKNIGDEENIEIEKELSFR